MNESSDNFPIQWNLAVRAPLYSYNSLFLQHVRTTFDSSFVRCSAIQIHTVIYRAKENKLQQRSKTFVLVMSTAQCSVENFFEGSCRAPRRVQIIKSLHLNFKQIFFALCYCLGCLFSCSPSLIQSQKAKCPEHNQLNCLFPKYR